jgi:hypothetical protein
MRASTWLSPTSRSRIFLPRTLPHSCRLSQQCFAYASIITPSFRGRLFYHTSTFRNADSLRSLQGHKVLSSDVNHKTHFPRRHFCFTSGEDRVISTSHSSLAQSTMATEKPADYRLPTNVKATHYDLTIKTDLDALKFWGYVITE